MTDMEWLSIGRGMDVNLSSKTALQSGSKSIEWPHSLGWSWARGGGVLVSITHTGFAALGVPLFFFLGGPHGKGYSILGSTLHAPVCGNM